MPEKMPPLPEWDVKIGDQVMLKEDLPESLRSTLYPHYQVGLLYTVLQIIPENHEGPAILKLGPGSLADEDIPKYKSEALGIAISHLRPAKYN